MTGWSETSGLDFRRGRAGAVGKAESSSARASTVVTVDAGPSDFSTRPTFALLALRGFFSAADASSRLREKREHERKITQNSKNWIAVWMTDGRNAGGERSGAERRATRQTWPSRDKRKAGGKSREPNLFRWCTASNVAQRGIKDKSADFTESQNRPHALARLDPSPTKPEETCNADTLFGSDFRGHPSN